jgi:hypothetical protein
MLTRKSAIERVNWVETIGITLRRIDPYDGIVLRAVEILFVNLVAMKCLKAFSEFGGSYA